VVEAVIVYTSDSTHWTANFLSDSVNHCFLCVIDRGRWVVYDLCRTGLKLYTVDSLPSGVYYQRVILKKKWVFPIFPTCVGLVKQAIGLKNPFILTPLQLLKEVENGRRRKKAEKNRRRKGG